MERVEGVNALARDVTGEREKEARFIRVGGVSFSTPERKLLDANPRLVQVSGCAS